MTITVATTGTRTVRVSPAPESPRLRAEWIARRRAEAARSGDDNMSQMHFARKGLVTEEMLYVAEREKLTPETVRSEVGLGQSNHPGQHQSP